MILIKYHLSWWWILSFLITTHYQILFYNRSSYNVNLIKIWFAKNDLYSIITVAFSYYWSYIQNNLRSISRKGGHRWLYWMKFSESSFLISVLHVCAFICFKIGFIPVVYINQSSKHHWQDYIHLSFLFC